MHKNVCKAEELIRGKEIPRDEKDFSDHLEVIWIEPQADRQILMHTAYIFSINFH